MKTNHVMGKCYAGMAGVVRDMKTANANFKQDGKVVEAEKTIQTMTREIGNLTVLMLDGNRSVGPDIKERYTAIVEARGIIEAAQAEKIVKKTVCPRCGHKTAAGMHYCGWCGEALVPEALTLPDE